MSELDEDLFALNKEGAEKMQDFLDNDDDPFKALSVIDPEATDEEDLEDSYGGKVILTCPVCHSDIFADPASLEIQQDTVTVHHECPYCHTTDEFEIKGQVVPFDGEVEEETKESEEETEDDGFVEETEEETEVKEESLKESVDNKKELNEEPRYDLRPEYDSRQSFHSKAYVDDEGSEKTLYSYHTKVAEIKDGKPILYPKWDYSSTTLRHVKEFLLQNGFKADSKSQIARDYVVENESLKESASHRRSRGKLHELFDNMTLNPSINTKITPNFSAKAEVKNDVKNTVNTRDIKFDKLADKAGLVTAEVPIDAQLPVNARDVAVGAGGGMATQSGKTEDKDNNEKPTRERSTKEKPVREDVVGNMLGAAAVGVAGGLANGVGRVVGAKIADSALNKGENEPLKEDKQAADVVDKYQEWVDYDMKKYGKISNITKKKLDKAGFEVVKDDHGDYEVIAKDLKESIDIHIDRDSEDVEIETDGLIVDTSDNDIHVEEKDEVIEPISKETEEEILGANDMADTEDEESMADIEAEVSSPEGEDTEESDEEEISLEGFEESYFNKLGTIYLRENYSNVRNFETSCVRENVKNNKLYVEGIINFKSGTKKNTSFVFEGKTISKTGRIKFLGENKEICTGKNAFTLRAKLNSGKVMCESLTYNYNVKDGKNIVNVSGKAKISK